MTTTYVISGHMTDFLRTGAAAILFDSLGNPADTLVGVSELAGISYGALIEVNVIAALD